MPPTALFTSRIGRFLSVLVDPEHPDHPRLERQFPIWFGAVLLALGALAVISALMGWGPNPHVPVVMDPM
ncbi:hypothetical protein SPF06_19750 [Sinomonas sp. JGH33]|uniref:Uncharacterized protein n=1 Tax=Sinomonas terricola TaxID=3110330 RepID=A0ABU5TB91_9MICC|nr:DUF3592 domain-containing protein [Sinomonas sp. JGH33]MEA5456963.1 hypothetical protein [Sinomonas sp. JGH33]